MKAVKKHFSETGKFAGILITRTDHDEDAFTQTRLQFIQALVDNLKSRFPDKTLLEGGACLSPTSWPENEDHRVSFGDEHVLNLAKLCHVVCRAALDDFRQHQNNTRQVGKTLELLIQRVNLLPVSSAECERGFSCMNI